MADFYDQVACHILTCHGVPDLRGAIVLLPNYHAAQPLAQALSLAANLPALLLPQMLTLGDWAATIRIDAIIQSDTGRVAALYQALRERKWFPDADLWSLARELLALMDELTRHHVELCESEAQFSRQLTEAYRAKSGASMQFEARVVHELWYAMAANGDMDASRAYQLRLSLLAQQVKMPLYVLQTCDLAVPEMRFLDACRERVEVTLFDLRKMVSDDPGCAMYVAALQQDMQSDDLRGLADILQNQPLAALTSSACSGQVTSTASGRTLSLFGAQGMEQEAQAADVQVRRWLLAGKKSIAVVVQDRLVARRLRALLERAEVLVQDETGWTFATLSVSTVLMRWLEAVQGDFYYQDVLDLFKSPYLFVDKPVERKQAAFLFEQLVRKQGVIAHLQDFISVAESAAPELVQPLVRLRQGAGALPVKPVTLANWLHALLESLEIIGVVQGWRQNAAGQQLLQLLSLWQDELQSDQAVCSFAEWRRWLSQQLDLNTYRNLSVQSPVLFTHLAATRWRSFDAVLLLGCDAAHLPAPASVAKWFNDSVRQTLGLPMSGAQQAQVRDDLLSLLAMNDTVLVTWQAAQQGEANLLSPHFEMLRALHLLAFGDDLMDVELAGAIEWARVRIEDAGCRIQDPGVMPKPVVLAALLPQKISPSAYNALVACPYQYFARHVLHLNELDEVREELDKRDYGTWVHAVLQRFHEEVPLLQVVQPAHADMIMRRISSEVFGNALAHDYLAQAWLLRWQDLIPGYLAWQLENEVSGWRYRGSELPFEVDVSDSLVLRGRLDRLDERVDDATHLSVLDYKTQSVQVLKSKLKESGEDVQLACYAFVQSANGYERNNPLNSDAMTVPLSPTLSRTYVAGEGVNVALRRFHVDAAFVSLEGESVQAVSPPDDLHQLSQLNLERLQTLFAQMKDGAGLPAHGAEKVCGYCEMKGLCRKGEWEANQDSGFRMQDSGSSHG